MKVIVDKDSLAIASTSLASSLLGSIFGFYYLKVFLNFYHLDTYWLNIGQILFMVWNAVNDPMFGYMQDVGFCGMKWLMNRRKVILYGSPFYALFFMVFWIPWIHDWNPNRGWIVGLHLIVALFLFDAMLSLVLSAQCGLFTELTTKHSGRVRVVVYMEVASLIGSFAIFPVDAVSKSGTNFFAFQMCCLAVMLVALVFFLVTGFLATDEIAQIKENATVENNETTKHHPGLLTMLTEAWTNAKSILRNMDFFCVVAGNFCHILRLTADNNFTVIFTEALVAQHGFLPIGSWSISAFYTCCNMLPKLLVLSCWPFLKKFGAYLTLVATIIATVLNSLVIFFIGRFNYIAIICFILLENILCLSLWPAVYNIFFPDVIDEDMKLNKRSRPFSTTIFTLNALFTKPAGSLAPIIIVSILNNYGYESYRNNHGSNFANETLVTFGGNSTTGGVSSTTKNDDLYDAMFLTMCLFPSVCALLELLCFAPYRLKFRHKLESENELSERNVCGST